MAATRDSAGDPGASGWDPDRLADTPLGHEIREFCRRLLGPGEAAAEATTAVLASPFVDRLGAVARAAAECRRLEGEPVALGARFAGSLAQAVRAELIHANAALAAEHRELLALRDMLRLSYRQIAAVMDRDERSVALGLAQARTSLREQLRGPSPDADAACAEPEQALAILARRQDSEPMGSADNAWLFAHMADCPACERAHAVMLEASVAYRAWGRG